MKQTMVLFLKAPAMIAQDWELTVLISERPVSMAPAMVHLVSLDPEVPILKVPVPVMVDLVSR